MKVAVLILVLANLAVFAWLRWADGPRHEANLVPLSTAGKKLSLVSETAVAPGSFPASRERAKVVKDAPRAVPAISTLSPTSASAAGSLTQRALGTTPICLIWPVASATVASGLVARLGAGGYPAHTFEREKPVPNDYRVILGGFADAVAAERAIAALRRGGMSDLYLLPAAESRGLALSLGVFGDRDDAEHRAAQVRSLGFDPQIRVTTHTHARRYLEARLPAAASVSAALLKVGITLEPRRSACTASPVAVSSGASSAHPAP